MDERCTTQTLREDGPLDLRSQLALVRRWAWLLVLCGAATGALTYFAYGLQHKLFEAKATVMVGQPLAVLRPTYAQALAWPEVTQTYAQIATTNTLLQHVAESLGGAVSAQDLRAHVLAVAPFNSTLITVTAQDSDPEVAARIANEVTNELVSISPPDLLTVIEPALPPVVASEPRIVVNAVLATAAGILIALAFVSARAYSRGLGRPQLSAPNDTVPERRREAFIHAEERPKGYSTSPYLRRQLSLIRQYGWMLVLLPAATGGMTYLVSSRVPKTYEAAATVIVGQSLLSVNVAYNDVLDSQRLSQMYAQLASVRPLLERVIARDGLSITSADLQEHVSAEAPLDSTLIVITVHDPDAGRAARLANDVAGELVRASPAFGREQPLAPTLLTVFEAASPPVAPSSPRTLVNTVLATAAGLLAALALMYVRAYFDDGTTNAESHAELTERHATLGG